MKNQNLPLFVKLYCWFFCINAAAMVVFTLFGIFYPLKINLLGFDSEPFSVLGSVIILVSIAKGILAHFMLKGNPTALKIGLIDAILSVLTILFVTFYPIVIYPVPSWKIRLSVTIIFSVIYLIFMLKLNKSKHIIA